MNRYFTLLPMCFAITACAVRPVPDVSHAKVWHAENGYARATTGQVPVYTPNQPNQYATAPTQSNPYVPPQQNSQNSYVAPPVSYAPAQPNPNTQYVAPQPAPIVQPAAQPQYVAPQPAPIVQPAVQYATPPSVPPQSPSLPKSTKSNSRYPVIIDKNTLHDPSSLPQKQSVTQPTPSASQLANLWNNSTSSDFSALIMQAENQSSGLVRNVLAQARTMTDRKEIIKGGCWDYLDAAWSRAGVSRNMRQTIYKSEPSGEYVNVNTLRAGDWIYHINLGYKNIQHSGMFIGWVDKSRNLGLTLSYAGEGRQEPARYKVYDLSNVYSIMRAPS